jgi:hypothetical protein
MTITFYLVSNIFYNSPTAQYRTYAAQQNSISHENCCFSDQAIYMHFPSSSVFGAIAKQLRKATTNLAFS